MVAVSGWALIPSLLSSRFPKNLRTTASNLAYNGGLAIGFATPFIMLENFLNQPQHMEWLIFVPVILGAIAMIIGATRLFSSINKKSIPSHVGMPGAGVARRRSSIEWIIILLVVSVIVVVFVVVLPVHSQPRQSSNANKTVMQIDHLPYVNNRVRKVSGKLDIV
jgi:hypothetical protein